MCMVNADIITSVLQIWVGVFGVGTEFCLQSLRPAYSLVLDVEVHLDCELASDFIVCHAHFLG
jgi:hypothetical protein